MAAAEQNFQPQVGDTTAGPHIHTYVPRADGSILVGGVAYVRQSAATIPVVGTTPAPAVVVETPAPAVVQTPYPYYMYPQFASLSSSAPIQEMHFVPTSLIHSPIPVHLQLLTSTYLEQIPPQPVIYQQPYIAQPQPVYAAASPAISPPYYNIQPQPYPSTGYPAFNISQPAQGTYGYTGTEMLMQNMGQAAHPDFTKKQDMKPSDPDPYRMYWCREPDNTWTQRNRMTIESGDIGDCRWYVTDGQFYAVRLG